MEQRTPRPTTPVPPQGSPTGQPGSTGPTVPPTAGSTRGPQRPQFERRRPGWSEFRRAYPGILATMSFALLMLLGIDAWLIYKRAHYAEEDQRLRAGMSTLQRQQADVIMANEENRLRVMIELVRRQAGADKSLHLKIPVDSGVMYLEQDGALLREMPMQVGPERRVGIAPDTVHMAAPRGARTV